MREKNREKEKAEERKKERMDRGKKKRIRRDWFDELSIMYHYN